MYIDNFSEKEGLLYINSTGRDPAFISSFDFAIFLDNSPFLIIAKELLYILTVSVVIFVLVKIVSLRYFIVRMNKITTIYDSKISDFMSDKNSRLKDLKILSALMAIAIFLHIYEASSFMLSIDDEYSAFRTATSAKIWIYDGRWMAYILSFAFPQPVMPYVPTLMFCFLMSLSYFLLVKSHKLQPDYRIYILYPVYILFPTFWFINEFYANTVNTAFGHVMVALSVFLFSRTRYGISVNMFQSFENAIFNALFPAIFFAMAIGIYQSFVMLYLAVGLGFILWRKMANDKAPHLGQFLLILILGMIFYFVINGAFKYFFPSDYVYVDNFWKIDMLMSAPLSILDGILREAMSYYSGSGKIFGISIYSLSILSVFSVIVLTTYQRVYIIFLWICILLSPFLLHFFTGGAGTLPLRSMVVFPYIFWFMAVIVLLAVEKPKVLVLNFVVIFFTIVQLLSVNGQYAASSNLTQNFERMLADDLYRRIAESNENFDRDHAIIIDVYGFISYNNIYPFPYTTTMQASFFNWDGGNMSRMLSFMRLLGYKNLSPIASTDSRKNNPIFEKMPSWPAKESVKFLDGIYLVKLGKNPDPKHR